MIKEKKVKKNFLVSPTKLPVTYSFFDALKKLHEGHKITRLDWKTNDIYCLLRAGVLHIFMNGEYFTWTINTGDMTATDWVILPE